MLNIKNIKFSWSADEKFEFDLLRFVFRCVSAKPVNIGEITRFVRWYGLPIFLWYCFGMERLH